MLVTTGGQERTADEYRALLAASGFLLARVIATGLASSIVEAVPASRTLAALGREPSAASGDGSPGLCLARLLT